MLCKPEIGWDNMDQHLLDLYSDYLIASFSLATATGLSALVDDAYSHDQITRFLGQKRYDQKTYWKTIKPMVRRVETNDGVLLVDDTIEEKPYTDDNDRKTGCATSSRWHSTCSYSHSSRGTTLEHLQKFARTQKDYFNTRLCLSQSRMRILWYHR